MFQGCFLVNQLCVAPLGLSVYISWAIYAAQQCVALHLFHLHIPCKRMSSWCANIYPILCALSTLCLFLLLLVTVETLVLQQNTFWEIL